MDDSQRADKPRLLLAADRILRHCDLMSEGETDWERDVQELRLAVAEAMTSTARSHGAASTDTVPLGTISECPSCGGDGKLTTTPGKFGPCWRCGGSGRVMAYRETKEQFDARMKKVKAFVAFCDQSEPPSSIGTPVAWRYRQRLCGGQGQPTSNWGDWRHVPSKPQGPESDIFQIEPLFATPSARAAIAPPTHDEVAAYRDLFRAELEKNMHNSSGSPSTDAHTVALHRFVEARNKTDGRAANG